MLKALSLEPMHGWGLVQRIEQMSKDVFQVQQGSLYPALQRMRRKGWVRREWRTSENNRRARYYIITAAGRRQLTKEVSAWERAAAAINRILATRLRHDASFALAAIGVLGLGLGAAATVFAVVHAVLLKPLPYPKPDRLVRVYQEFAPGSLGSLSVVDVEAIAAQQRTLEAFGTLRVASASLSADGQPESVLLGRATSGFFAALRVGVAAGRPRWVAPSRSTASATS